MARSWFPSNRSDQMLFAKRNTGFSRTENWLLLNKQVNHGRQTITLFDQVPFPEKVLLPILISSHPEVFCKKGVPRNFTKFTAKHLCQSLFKKETLRQVFSCEFCKISKNTFSHRVPLVAASQFYKVVTELMA